MNHKEKFLHHKELNLGCSVTIRIGANSFIRFVVYGSQYLKIVTFFCSGMVVKWVARKNWRIQLIWNTISESWIKPSGPHCGQRVTHVWFTSIQAGNTACNYRTHYHLVLSHKTNQNQGICYVTKTFVTRNKFPLVKVARNTKKVGQAWITPLWINPCCTKRGGHSLVFLTFKISKLSVFLEEFQVMNVSLAANLQENQWLTTRIIKWRPNLAFQE